MVTRTAHGIAPKCSTPLNKGGSGAFQLIGRVDYLDLTSNKLRNGTTTNFATGAQTLAALNVRQARGGTQTGYLLGLTWIPVDYVRFLVNCIHLEVKGGPFAQLVDPSAQNGIGKFSDDAVAVRAQVDF